MGWEILLPIIAREGLNVGYELWRVSQQRHMPTQEDWDRLFVVKKAEDFLQEARDRAALLNPPPQ